MTTDAAGEEMAYAVAVAHQVAVLAETNPAAPLVVATRAALEVADARRADRRARRIAGLDVHGGEPDEWAGRAEHWVSAVELAARRATPVQPVPDGEIDCGR